MAARASGVMAAPVGRMAVMNAILIPAENNQPVEAIELPDGLGQIREMERILAGPFTPVFIDAHTDQVSMWQRSEEDEIRGPVNERATAFWKQLAVHDERVTKSQIKKKQLFGDVLVTGGTANGAKLLPLPPDLIKRLKGDL